MRRSSVLLLGLAVFGLIFLAFLIRAFGQFVVGTRTATLVAGPVAMLAGAVLLGVIGIALLAKAGLVTLEDGSD